MCGEGLPLVVLGLWDEILVGPQHVCTIAHRRQVLDLLPKDLTSCDRPSSTDKAEDLSKMESTASQSLNCDFFSDERAEFIDFNE